MTQLPENVIVFLKEEFDLQHQKEDDITTGQAMKLWNVARQTAREKLRKMCEEGKMIELTGKLLNGAYGNFYRIVK